jgi:malate:Na+ symporter
MKNLSTPEVQMKSAWGDQQIAGMPMMIFLGLATCVLYAGWNGSLPLGMVGALALMFVLGTLLSELGERIPPHPGISGGWHHTRHLRRRRPVRVPNPAGRGG